MRDSSSSTAVVVSKDVRSNRPAVEADFLLFVIDCAAFKCRLGLSLIAEPVQFANDKTNYYIIIVSHVLYKYRVHSADLTIPLVTRV